MVYVLAMPELFYTIQMIYNRNQEVIPLLMVGACWYLVITSVLAVIQLLAEKMMAKSERKAAPHSPAHAAAVQAPVQTPVLSKNSHLPQEVSYVRNS